VASFAGVVLLTGFSDFFYSIPAGWFELTGCWWPFFAAFSLASLKSLRVFSRVPHCVRHPQNYLDLLIRLFHRTRPHGKENQPDFFLSRLSVEVEINQVYSPFGVTTPPSTNGVYKEVARCLMPFALFGFGLSSGIRGFPPSFLVLPYRL